MYLRPVAVIAAVLITLFLLGYTLMAAAVIHVDLRAVGLPPATHWAYIIEAILEHWCIGLLEAVLMPVLVILLMPLTFLMIPVTLRAARVRMRHVLRIGLYAWGLPCFVAAGWVLVQMITHLLGLETIAFLVNPWLWPSHWWPRGMFIARDDSISIGIGVLAAGWMMCWWWYGCSRYLRLPRPGRIAGTMVAISLLAALTVKFWTMVL